MEADVDADIAEDLTEEEIAARRTALDALGKELAKLRSEAIDGRYQSGIETEWAEDEEFYEGIDDANRAEMTAWGRKKPLGQAGLMPQDSDGVGSTVFLNITRPYCDAASARLSDMLLPVDEDGWDLGPTPIPELAEIAKGKIPNRIQNQVRAAFMAKAGQDPNSQALAEKGIQDTLVQLEQQERANWEAAVQVAERAKRRIRDWHIESQYHAQVRKTIEYAARLGTGVLKGPIPEYRKSVVFRNGAIQITKELKPVSREVSCWNCFPDPDCGSNIHNGAYHWERDDITPKALALLRDQPGYLADEIEQCLKEGPHRAVREFNLEDARGSVGLVPRDRSKSFEIWYFYGSLTREQLDVMGCKCPDDSYVMLDVAVTMVNNRPIRAVPNHLDTGEFPYDYMVWQERTGMPWGLGVARQIRTPQRIVVAGGRALMDNAGAASGPMLLTQQGIVTPANGVLEVRPWKTWLADEDADAMGLDRAFRFVAAPIMQAELTAIIQLGLRLAEDVTGLPALLQGQQGQAPDTVGGMQMLNNNATSVLRRLTKLFDDNITEPHIRRYYRYLLQYGEDNEKGDLQIDARGSSALVERDTQAHQLAQMANIVANPMFGIDPKKWATEWMKSQRFDVRKLEFSDEDWKAVIERMQQPQQDIRIDVAKLQAQVAQMRIESAERIAGAKIQVEQQEGAAQRQHEQVLRTMDEWLDQRAQGGERAIGLDKIKAKLAEVAMTIAAQRDLAQGRTLDAPQVARPVAEPPQRAAAGHAFQE